MQRESLIEFRQSQGLSQTACAEELDLSKGYLSKLEAGLEPASLRLALRIERWSNGRVPALGLVSGDDELLLREAIVRAGGKIPAEAQPA